MESVSLIERVTFENFSEAGYLEQNPDVARAVEAGGFETGFQHFKKYGHKEARNQQTSRSIPEEIKQSKLDRIHPLLREDLAFQRQPEYWDFLSEDLREEFSIVETDNVSCHEYDAGVMALIEKHADGLLLDCGAGFRPTYFSNVVNFEIADYPTTDVRGVGEVLPFQDDSFDAVISVAVLEHVKDPFQCAREISRVLKPDGELFCCVPFLQPLHAYPHHYYNMTHAGLQNLFNGLLQVEGIECNAALHPIQSLTWILNRWAQALPPKARKQFLKKKVGQLLGSGFDYSEEAFVQELPQEMQFALASGFILHARKAA